MKQNHDKEKLEAFFRTVAHLTQRHDGIRLVIDTDGDEQDEAHIATVSPAKLGKALAAVDPNWWK